MSELLSSCNHGLRKMVPCIPKQTTPANEFTENLTMENDEVTTLKHKLMEKDANIKKLETEVDNLKKRLIANNNKHYKEKKNLEDKGEELNSEISYLTNYLEELKGMLELNSTGNDNKTSRDINTKCKEELDLNEPENHTLKNKILKLERQLEQALKLIKLSPDANLKGVISLNAVLEMKQDEIYKLTMALFQANKMEAKLFNAMNRISELELKCANLTEQLKQKGNYVIKQKTPPSSQQYIKLSRVVCHNTSCGFIMELGS